MTLTLSHFNVACPCEPSRRLVESCVVALTSSLFCLQFSAGSTQSERQERESARGSELAKIGDQTPSRFPARQKRHGDDSGETQAAARYRHEGEKTRNRHSHGYDNCSGSLRRRARNVSFLDLGD